MKVAIIGSGIGGIAVACRLAIKGHSVTVYEKNELPGGKINEIRVDGYRFDSGPSLFTMPELVEQIYELAGEKIPTSFKYNKLDVLCKYFYNTGEQLVAYSDKDKFIEECDKFGEKPGNIRKYLSRAEMMYKLTADIFIFNSLHKLKNYLKLSVLKSFLQINKLSVNKTMNEANKSIFDAPKVIQMFNRYATYNGSNPYKAPATLNVIAHLENNLGAYFPAKGMYSIVQHLYQLAVSKGVTFKFNQIVSEIKVFNKKATGIVVEGKEYTYDYIVANTDVNYLANNMIKHPLKKRLKKLEPSSSALVFYWGVKKQFSELDVHNILFSGNYKEEFNCLFDRQTIYADPTVYIFISSKIIASDAPANCENWFVMINSPANNNQNWNELIETARGNIVKKINKTLEINIEDYIEFEKMASPETIQNNTLSKSGALYGNSSNSMFSAFLRHPNFLKGIKNLYFVGGSVHPGGGIPLCLASAQIVDNEIPN